MGPPPFLWGLRAEQTAEGGGQLHAELLPVCTALPSLLVTETQLEGPIIQVDRWDI